MGRADQTTKVKGMFVHPAQVAEVAKRHPELGRAAAAWSTREAEQDVDDAARPSARAPTPGSSRRVAETLQAVTKLKRRGGAGRAGQRCRTTAR